MHRWHLLLVPCIALSCAAPVYRPTVHLSEQLFQSSDDILRGRVPQGWFDATDPELTPHLSAWLLRDDYGAALTFQEITVDHTTARHIASKGLKLLAELSFRLKQAEYPTVQIVSAPSIFSIEGMDFCRYNYNSQRGSPPTGVVVFRIRGHFFESTIATTRGELSAEELQQLMDVQQATLASLQQ